MSGIFLPGANQFTASLQFAGLTQLGWAIGADVVDDVSFDQGQSLQGVQDAYARVDANGGVSVDEPVDPITHRCIMQWGGCGGGHFSRSSRSRDVRPDGVQQQLGRLGNIVFVSGKTGWYLVSSTTPLMVTPLDRLGPPERVEMKDLAYVISNTDLVERRRNQARLSTVCLTHTLSANPQRAKLNTQNQIEPFFPGPNEVMVQQLHTNAFVYSAEMTQLLGYLFSGQYYPIETIAKIYIPTQLANANMTPRDIFIHKPTGKIVGVLTRNTPIREGELYSKFELFRDKLFRKVIELDNQQYEIQYNGHLKLVRRSKATDPVVKKVIPSRREDEPIPDPDPKIRSPKDLVEELFPGLASDYAGDPYPTTQVQFYKQRGMRSLTRGRVSGTGSLYDGSANVKLATLYNDAGEPMGYLVDGNLLRAENNVYFSKDHVITVKANLGGLDRTLLVVYYKGKVYPVASIKADGDLESIRAYENQMRHRGAYKGHGMTFRYDSWSGTFTVERDRG